MCFRRDGRVRLVERLRLRKSPSSFAIGRRYTLLIALVIAFVAIAIEFITTTNAVFFIGKLIQGFSIGIIATTMTCFLGVSYGIGPLVAFIIINYTGNVETRWAYRITFCSQWGFAAVATIIWPWMPESPWWLVSTGKDDKALASLYKLGYTGERGAHRLLLFQVPLEEVKRETAGVTYAECFRKSNLRRTIISAMPMCIQSLSGIAFVAGYFTYYLQLAGYSTKKSFQMQIAQPVLSIVGNLMAAAIIDKVGRRALTFYGLIILTTFLLITSGLGLHLFSTLHTVAIGLALSSAINVTWQFTIPYMFNPDQANLGAKIAFIFGGTCLLCLVYLFLYQPETTGRNYQGLGEMFAKGVPARNFKGFQSAT
ncbi:hypothetical protein HBI56_168580 [Parastagonospora nodorum]|nr:hypothetical protein HBH53_184010 [Parastagonospora nodorum]KAH3964263.1 hypothetical protein HBH51_161820 [Parastagonospora nodorum]KAH3988653.1 hypothetical protein HBH52_025140 [Parastagonospora nodorum]KAH3997521.1 hypothetical protein HBI10_143220 [Parastagonospora nodorum]KAH4021097.1 hypothetical protein HBI13_111520 [Parastagonospora nodorum]